MKTLLQSVAVVAALCGGLNTRAFAGEPIQLFNGENLRGWQAYLSQHGVARREVWSVEEGLLVCKGEPMGYLYTNQKFESFKLVVEWRWAPGTKPGNNGVLMRINGEPRPLPRCIEAQLQHGNAGDLYGFHGMKISGDAERKVDNKTTGPAGHIQGVKKMRGNENPPGEWNRYEIVLDGPKLTVSVNGQKVNEAIDCEVIAGPVGIQSEGGVIHFRKIELTPID
ncbi:MAG: DUF1080 domain-containing protein [Verrucomicrobia bacterium]|nr:DUF1080 domain-containing protein [Verrucomicrobiota bacterium]